MWALLRTYRLKNVSSSPSPAGDIIRHGPGPVNAHPKELMREFVAGLVLIAVWIVLQFVVQPATGWIHVALAAGVILVIRGIALDFRR